MPDTTDNSGNAAEEPLDPFDAFRARRAQERAENEPFPEQQHGAEGYGTQTYGTAEYDPGQYAQPLPETPRPVESHRRGRLRSVAVLGGAAVLVAGAVGGVYAATRPSGSPAAATSPGVTASATATPSPSAGASKGAKNGKAVTARLTVTSVGPDSFTATTAAGQTISVRIAPATKFGTAARPFTRSQLVPGTVVYARLRREADGAVVATVIASATADKGGAASASPTASASASADTGA